MKTQFPTRLSRRGFTLIELLVVISIIVILAGVVIGASGFVKKKMAADLTRVRIKDASLKVEEYARDNNGLYPVGEDVSSAILYNALSGDFTGQGETPTGETYWKELLTDDPNLVSILNGKKIILDGFSQSLRYRSARDSNGEIVPEAKNDGSFDLWSIGPDGEPSDLNVNSNDDGEDTKDDIWN